MENYLDLIDDIWFTVREYIPDEHAKNMADDIVRVFESHGCDIEELAETETYQIAHSDDEE